MKRINVGDPEAGSADIVAENVDQLRSLFPEAFAEGRLDMQIFRQLVGDLVVDEEMDGKLVDEKYGLNWKGKRRARQLALTSSLGTLRPCEGESVDWDNTKNLMIEGDNLEVLKLLQKSYSGKVKLIYIDPPYNTGKDFVYPDNFHDNIRNYLELTGQVDSEGRKLTSNAESSGRFHTDWLNMMYPRLKLARNLLRDDGVIFISIDDHEVANLRIACDEIFGGENLIAEMVWEGANKNDARQIGVCHEYVLVFARNREEVPREWKLKKEGVLQVLEEAKKLRTKYGNDFETASNEMAGWYRSMKSSESFAHRRYRFIDARGLYKEENPTAPGGRKFQLIDPRNGRHIRLRDNRGWAFDQTEFDRLVAEERITFVTDTSIMQRLYLEETDQMTPPSVFYQPARSASERLAKLMDSLVFDFPKDELVISKFVEMASDSVDRDCVVLDFFAGSGTTGHAVISQNASDHWNRRYILVQLPDPLDPTNKDQKTAADYCDKLGKPRTIAELTKERLRRAGDKIRDELAVKWAAEDVSEARNKAKGGGLFEGAEDEPEAIERRLPDLGFRVFKLDTSNIRIWNPDADHLGDALLDNADHILLDRTDDDVLYEMLLKLGVDLTAPIAERTIAGKKVVSIGSGALMACLEKDIQTPITEELATGIAAWHAELAPAGDTTVFFRDRAFADDVAKSNLTCIIEQHATRRGQKVVIRVRSL